MITDDFSLKQHSTLEYLVCQLDSDLNGESLAGRFLKKVNIGISLF